MEMVKELLSGDYIMMWEKVRPLVTEIRKLTPFSVDNFEWLYNELKKSPSVLQQTIRKNLN